MNKHRILSIDIETFSDVDLAKCGVYRYVEGDFHILLFAYAFDDEDVKIVNLACGETLPQEVVDAVFDPAIIKAAWNAQFERTCLSKYFQTQLSPDSWQCSMVWAASLSLPLALKNAALVLKTGEQKDRAGENQIKYFSIPCKPTKKNGGRTRNLPEHDPEGWKTFTDYCLQDVRTERDIRKKLEQFPLPAHEWDYYRMDQRINDRGVMIDRELVQQAIACDLMLSEEMTKRAYELTGLENPNSVSQLKTWLDERGIKAESLGKKDVAVLIRDLDQHSTDQEALDMMQLRLQMAKSSVKKYQAAERYICSDGRAHGLFQFSGANRTQRWCLTGDHEILSSEGWVRLDKWEGGEIACWNPITEVVSFQKANALSFDYSGDMYKFEDKRISQISTPDHKMWIKRRYNSEWGSSTVEEMASCRPSIPFTGRRMTMPSLKHEQLRVLVMTQADGHYTNDGQLRFHFSKDRKTERCKHLLRQAEIPFSINSHEKTGTTTIAIPSRGMPMYLRMFKGKTFGTWLLDESPEAFFDELRYWDGSKSAKNSIQYCTTNKMNADIIQAFAHTSGRCAKMKTVVRGEDYPNWRDAYYLDIWLTPGNCHEIRNKPTVEFYEGKVYCAETKTGFFLVRREGKVWVTGNSGRGIQIQNLPQNHITTLDEARELVKMGCFDMVESIYGNTPDILSQLIRTMLIPKPGCEFIVADFSAIEARVLAWLAGEQWRLDAFERGDDIYCASASQMFGVPVVKHGINGELRQKGKVAELACGYGGAAGALISMGALDMGLTESELPDLINDWRTSNPHIVQFWWDVEKAAVETIKDHNDRTVGRISFQFSANTLWIVLPSGRKLAYIKPRLQSNRFGRMAITFESLNAANKWARGETYSGKLVENCIAEGTLVLTRRGLVPIEDISDNDLIWDGKAWMQHGGLIYMGIQKIVEVISGGDKGIHMTGDHKILTKSGWRSSIEAEGLNWEECRLPDGIGASRERPEWKGTMEMPLLLRKRNCSPGFRIAKGKKRIHFLWMHEKSNNFHEVEEAWDESSSGMGSMAQHEAAVSGLESSGLSQLWGKGYHGLRTMADKLREFLGGYGPNMEKRTGPGSDRQQSRLRAWKLLMDRKKNQQSKQANKQNYRFTAWPDDSFRTCRKNRNRGNHTAISSGSQLANRITVHSTGRSQPVYDIRNCGPRHRFTVWDPGAGCLRIVSNCTQATARDLLAEAMWRMEQAGLSIVGHVHDEVILEVPANSISVDDVCAIMNQNPEWAEGLPLSSAGYLAPQFYFKD